MPSRGVAFGAIAAGAVLAYAGAKGYSVTATLQRIVTGKTPVGQAQTAAIGTPAGGSSSSGGGGSAAAPAGPGEKAWIVAFLTTLGAPPTSANISSMTSWIHREQTGWPAAAKYNPMNTTLREPGSTDFNSVHVQNYTSVAQGIKANADTITGGYPGILSALRSGKGLCGAAPAEFSRWSGGGYSSVC